MKISLINNKSYISFSCSKIIIVKALLYPDIEFTKRNLTAVCIVPILVDIFCV